METLGPWGPEASGFVSELGRRLAVATGDPRSGAFLKQKISIAVQRGNAFCISGSFPRDTAISEDFYTWLFWLWLSLSILFSTYLPLYPLSIHFIPLTYLTSVLYRFCLNVSLIYFDIIFSNIYWVNALRVCM